MQPIIGKLPNQEKTIFSMALRKRIHSIFVVQGYRLTNFWFLCTQLMLKNSWKSMMSGLSLLCQMIQLHILRTLMTSMCHLSRHIRSYKVCVRIKNLNLVKPASSLIRIAHEPACIQPTYNKITTDHPIEE